ncbi:MAG: pyruvate kinase alpha/beta domain-containing protein, partial [Candidatus Bathyarchaeia archaeon]
RAVELGVKDIVVASTHGATALKAAEVFEPKTHNLVAVSICEGFREEGWAMTDAEKKRLIEKGIKVLTSIHALGDGVGNSFAEKFGGKSIEEIVQQTFYRFCQGMKVCVEIVLMAADAGLIPMDKEVMAIAGTGSGADTCIVVKPAYPRKFLELEIREIVTKPRHLS